MQSYGKQVKRILVGKIIGLIFGICAFVCADYFLNNPSSTFKWGLLIWYTIFGHVVGNSLNAGEYVESALNIKVPWYFICIVIGSSFGLAITWLAEKQMHILVSALSSSNLDSPYWVIVDNVCAAIVAGFIVEKQIKH